MIEMPEDIAEEIATKLGIYGACEEPTPDKCKCRCCFVSGLVSRMRLAVQMESKLSVRQDV